MNYEDFIYELIKLLMNWGTWNDGIKIYYDHKIYEPFRMPESTYRDLKNVAISDDTEEKIWWPEGCIISVEENGPLNNLYEFGVLETDLDDLPLSKKIEAYQKNVKLQEEFQIEYDREDIHDFPERYGLPSALEFDSADEYNRFIEEEIDRAEEKYIADLSGHIEYGNDLEAEIGVLCHKYGLEYDHRDVMLFIGKPGFWKINEGID